MISHLLSPTRLVPLLAALAMVAGGLTLTVDAQAPKPAAPAPAPRAPQTRRPATPAKPAPAKPTDAAKAPEPAKPAVAAPQDVRFKSTYSAAGMKTESVTYIKGDRERFEFQDMILLKQHDQKRTIQISKAANTYLVAPDGIPAMPALAGVAPAAPPRPPGVIMIATTIVDTGERKSAFGQQARHVKVMIDQQPMPNACDTSKQRMETDGWYIDAPKAITSQSIAGGPDQPVAIPGGCADQIQATSNGDPKVLGFPIAYTTTIIGEDGKPLVAAMEVTEFEATTLGAALFEIPPGLNAAMNLRDLSKALSDANEVKLAAVSTEPAAGLPPKAAGVVRIGVPEFTNKTTQTVDTRGLRQRLIGELAEAKFDAVPMAAGTPADLQKRADAMGMDYVLFAEVSELKASKPSGIGGIMKAASGIAGGRTGGTGAVAGAAVGAAAPKETTESSIAVKLVQPDGKQRLSTTAKGKDGSGFSLQTGIGMAKFAGSMYMTMLAGPMMMARLNSMGAANLGGVGLMSNPAMYRMQSGGLAGLGKGMGVDATAGAASYLMQTAMSMNDLGGLVGAPGQGPSYDESLGEAVQNTSKAVLKALEKK